MSMNEKQELNVERAPHILNTSSNLLGFTFLILTSTRIVGLAANSVVPKIAAGCVAIFAVSSLLSYASIHARTVKRGRRLEAAASYIFFFGQLLLTVGAILLSINFFE